jgi:hypothetical protein
MNSKYQYKQYGTISCVNCIARVVHIFSRELQPTVTQPRFVMAEDIRSTGKQQLVFNILTGNYDYKLAEGPSEVKSPRSAKSSSTKVLSPREEKKYVDSIYLFIIYSFAYLIP